MLYLKTALSRGASVLALSFCAAPAMAHGLPGHGRFAEGQGHIGKAGGELTVEQDSRTGIVNWSSFTIGRKNGVTFDNGHGATLNIVKGGNISRIAGDLHGTGSVYLINRAGVLITGTGRVDTAGSFIASSRNADGDAFGSKRLRLTGSAKGNVINRGAITSANAVTLYGNITQAGRISAKGIVETSGEHVRLRGASVSANRWLIDPANLTVNGTAAKHIDNSLNNGTDVTLRTTKIGATGPGKKSSGAGDITIAAPLSWSGNATLDLDAWHSVAIDKSVTIAGKGTFDIETNDGAVGGDFTLGSGAIVTFNSLQGHLTIGNNAYKLIGSLKGLANAVAADPGGYFALAHDYDASADGTYQKAVVPTFHGTFEGLGHTISGLKIHNTVTANTGLFGFVHSAQLRDVTLAQATIYGAVAGENGVGALVGTAALSSVILNVHASGSVSGAAGGVGGIAGVVVGSISGSSSRVNVDATAGGTGNAGGLVGSASGEILNSSASGNVSSTGITGGLFGQFSDNGTFSGSVVNSHATGDVSGEGVFVGGLGGGLESGKLLNSYATGDVDGTAGNAGGLVGDAETAYIKQSFATGDVTAEYAGGGLAGRMVNTLLYDGYATGNVVMITDPSESDQAAGGLVGYLLSYRPVKGEGNFPPLRIRTSYSTGMVSGDPGYTGGLIGDDESKRYKISDAYWDMTTSGITDPSQGAGNKSNVTGITGLSDSQLKGGLPAGFDSSIWAQGSGINDGLPYLLGNPPP